MPIKQRLDDILDDNSPDDNSNNDSISDGRDDTRGDSITGGKGPKYGYSFGLDEDGDVINLTRVKKNGRTKNEKIEAGESWTFVDVAEPGLDQLVHSEIYPNGTEVTTYTDPNNDGIFTRTSEVFMPLSPIQQPLA